MKCHPRTQGPARSDSPGHGGFTLIELMVVVGILGMVLALGVPPFIRSMRKDPLRQAASDIAEACSEARAKSILLGIPTELVIRAEGGQITVTPAPEPPAAAGESGEPPPAPVSNSPVFSAQLQEDVAISLLYVNLKDQMQADETHVHFYPNGTSDEFTIVFQTGRGIRKISLECVTGLANLEVIR